jgi:hypothetical protein
MFLCALIGEPNTEVLTMANMTAVNKAIKQQFPDLDIEAVRGSGYVYFDGDDGFNSVESIYAHPSVTPTDDMIRMCIDGIEFERKKQGCRG